MHGIENETQLGGSCGLKGHGKRIIVILCPDNQLSIHNIARQIGETTADGRILEDQSSVLNPSSASIKSRSAFRLVKIGWQEMHDDRALPDDNLGYLGIVKLDNGVHMVSGLTGIRSQSAIECEYMETFISTGSLDLSRFVISIVTPEPASLSPSPSSRKPSPPRFPASRDSRRAGRACGTWHSAPGRPLRRE